MANTYRKVTEFKTVEEFSSYLKSENIDIPLAPSVPADGSSALARSIRCYGRTIGNRWAILPMEGWDCMGAIRASFWSRSTPRRPCARSARKCARRTRTNSGGTTI